MAFYAGGFIYDPSSKEVLLHLRDNKTENNPGVWAFFGGLSKTNERPEETFKREIVEELGIVLNEVKYLRDYFNPDLNTHRYVFFETANRKPEIELSEGDKAQWLTVANALKLSLSKRTREDLIYFKKGILSSL